MLVAADFLLVKARTGGPKNPGTTHRLRTGLQPWKSSVRLINRGPHQRFSLQP